MNFKYVIEMEHNPYHNLAFEEWLVRSLDKEDIVVYLWQNEHTIVVGRNQNIYAECKVDEFLSSNGKLARRNSGGGAVYHDLGNVNFSIISSVQHKDLCDYRKLLKEVLESFGLKTNFNGRNDLMINGCKFSGNAAYITSDEVICQHGTVLISANIETMANYLTPEKRKLERNAVASVASRVINLSEICDEITVANFCQAFVDRFDMQPLNYDYDKIKLMELEEIYSSKNWIFRGIK